MGELQRYSGISLKFQLFRARGHLILINHEWACESYAVVSKLPARGIAIGRSRKRPPAQHKKVSTAMEKSVNLWPSFLRECGAVRKHEQSGRSGIEHGSRLFPRGLAGCGQYFLQLLRRGTSRVCGRKSRFAKDNDGWWR